MGSFSGKKSDLTDLASWQPNLGLPHPISIEKKVEKIFGICDAVGA